eukprot:4064847-Amphidinium_carterae.1
MLNDRSQHRFVPHAQHLTLTPVASQWTWAREGCSSFVWARYSVQDLLGDGTFGRVLLARDRRKGRQVAVKVASRSA